VLTRADVAPARPVVSSLRTPALPRTSFKPDWLLIFAIFEILTQLALLVPGIGPARVFFRTASFAASLIMLALVQPRGRFHPAFIPAAGAMIVIGISIFHPTTNSWLSGVAQAVLYLAIFAPLVWVPGLGVTTKNLRRLLLVLWAFGLLSAVFGVLQVYFPGKFQPNLSAAIQSYGDWYVEDLKITLPSGERILRPMGLTDSPGGAASGASYAMLLGLGLFCTSRRWGMRALALLMLPTSLFCLYVCQVRVTLVVSLLSALLFVFLMGLRGELRRMLLLVAILVAVLFGSFAWATAVGGSAVTNRISSLFDEKPGNVYYSNRGHFLEDTVNVLLPKYPLGAGLGRWGMMNYYFGNNDNPDTKDIWAEIQWTGWLLDGGVPLVVFYSAALALTMWIAVRCAIDPRVGELSIWSALLASYNISLLAATFNNPIFIGQSGLEFWIINAALYCAYVNELVARRTPRMLETSDLGTARPT